MRPGAAREATGKLLFGERQATIKDPKKEIGPGLLHDMLKQWGLTKEDLSEGQIMERTVPMRFVYPYTIHQSADGAWQIRFPDVPEALTEGESEAEAHALATDALIAALGGLTKLRRDLPTPSENGQFFVVVPVLQSAKLALYQAMRDHKLNNVTLARKLGSQESEVRRMLDLDHQTKIGTLEIALWQLGEQIVSEVRKAA